MSQKNCTNEFKNKLAVKARFSNESVTTVDEQESSNHAQMTNQAMYVK